MYAFAILFLSKVLTQIQDFPTNHNELIFLPVQYLEYSDNFKIYVLKVMEINET
jgi:hypothetical protein